MDQVNLDRRLIFTASARSFFDLFKSFISSQHFFISSPVFLTQIWKFIAPGLIQK